MSDAVGPAGSTASKLAEVGDWVRAARSIAVLTGAGISTDSGIPDFRGPQGVWTRNPEAERMSNLRYYLEDPEVRERSWRNRREHPAWKAEPNAGHRALVELERSGRNVTLITQNIDELHQRAGSDPSRVLELHGTMHWVMCMSCSDRTPMTEALRRVDAGETDPACTLCGGILKSATISFGQQLDPDVLRAATAAAEECDLFLAIGSSLTVQPAAGLVEIAAFSGALVVIVNGDPTPYDDIAQAVLLGRLGELLPALVDPALR